MIVEEKTLSTERIYEGEILNLRRDRVTVRGGGTSPREIVEHNGGVALAAITGEGRMVMVRQFRKAAEKTELEVPAGKTGAGEDPAAAALRELKEETGYTAESLEHLTAFYPSLGYSTEVLHLYLATGLSPGDTDFDEHEAIDICEYELEALMDMVNTGEIEDAKTIIAVLIANNKRISGEL
ncbi:MAG: NUDIX hydrolase [Clostridiales Family XIII bacterium]|jgi:ADP-ribose pyrophosphatase|nr:NUDIX hydrolase [Clostridiales Family XIII bacterium]